MISIWLPCLNFAIRRGYAQTQTGEVTTKALEALEVCFIMVLVL